MCVEESTIVKHRVLLLLVSLCVLGQLADLWLCERLRALRAADGVGAFAIDLGFNVLVVAFEADVGGVLLASDMSALGELV